MLKKITKCCLAMLFLVWMLPSTVLAADINTIDTAYPLKMGQTEVNGRTYYVYTNKSKNIERLIVYSTVVEGVSIDPYVEVYKLSDDGYSYYKSDDDSAGSLNFECDIYMEPGETVCVYTRTCNHKDTVVRYNLHATVKKYNNGIVNGTQIHTASVNNDMQIFTVPTTGYYSMDYTANTRGSVEVYNLEVGVTEYGDGFYGDGKMGPMFLVAGYRYLLEYSFLSAEGTSQWRFIKGTTPIEDGVSISKIPDQPYTGEEIRPEFYVYYNGKDVRKEYNGNYYYDYIHNNTDVGTALARIYYVFNVDGERHSGYYMTIFSIKKDMSKASVKVGNLVYSGKAVAPTATVVFGGKTLKAGTDYKVIPDKNVNAGTKTATIQGTGNYMGTIAAKYVINKANQTINVTNEFIKNKSSKKFDLKATAPGALSYQTSNKKIVTVDSTGKVSLKKKYGIANIVITAAATQNYNAAAKTVRIVVTSKATKIASVKSPSKKKATVKIRKATGAQGYEISYSTDSTFKTGVKTTTTKKATATLKKLKSKKTYYVRVRSYRKVGGQKLYSTYSAAKKVKVK
ncbi:MAG: hypothetical protein E7264_00470 [Lachnospiraceae bacterium]|nr:hypothetical protein [Lachnospiraceae bacterium]